MPLAKDAAKATRKPIISNEVVSAFTKPIAAVEAMKRFEGPANGIKLKPKAVRKINMNSIIEAIFWFPLSSAPKVSMCPAYKCKGVIRLKLSRRGLKMNVYEELFQYVDTYNINT
jgi:hypothetical protein